MPPEILAEYGIELAKGEERFQASMGIYIFHRKAMIEALDNDLIDFGKDVIPNAIREKNVFSYVFQGYWEDIGTIGAFYQANLDLCQTVPDYDFFSKNNTVYTNARFLPASKINGASVRHSIISDGCIITDAVIENSLIGLRSMIDQDTTIIDSVVMGADFFPHEQTNSRNGDKPVGIGKGCKIERAIIDKNVHIGDGCVISPKGKPDELDGDNYFIRDGIVVIPKSAVIPANTWI